MIWDIPKLGHTLKYIHTNPCP